MFMWISFLFLSVLCAEGAVAALSTESGTLKQSVEAPGIPTTITSKKMTVRNQDGQAVFEGMVVLTRGALVVHSDRMVVSFRSRKPDLKSKSPNGTSRGAPAQSPSPSQEGGAGAASTISNRSVSRIEAMADTNHVKIEYENGNATCQKAVYFVEGEKVVLTGDPVAWERGTRVSGQQITLFLAEERSVVEGGSHVRIEGEGANTP
ncbi:lipopolysaccharide export system protein LptA [Nitrospira sp.]|nr:lipopolysaccharide export system protein LptA [Nitrospira sp.]